MSRPRNGGLEAAAISGRTACGLLACVLAASAGAQVQLQLHLQADAARRGPPALLFARAQLPRLCGKDLDPLAALALTLDADGLRVETEAAAPPAAAYLSGSLRLSSGASVVGRCDASGHETWRGPAAAFDVAPLRDFVVGVDLARPLGKTSWIEVSALVGVLASGIETETPLGLLLTLGASECGDLIVRGTQRGAEIELEGRSGGGLALPALLLAFARRHASAPLGEEERWIALAFAARDARREEAALQLARFDSAQSARCLLALLQVPGAGRDRALEALARRRAAELLPDIATTTAVVDRDPVAMASLATLWPTCAPAQRRRTRTELASSLGVLATLDALDDPTLDLAPRRDTGPAPAAAAGWRLLLLVLLAVPALLLGHRVLTGPRRSARGTRAQSP